MSDKYNIVVGGCSYVHDAVSFARKWKGEIFSEHNVINVGIGASSNVLNARTALRSLFDVKDNGNKTICVFEVTTPNRHEFLFDSRFEHFDKFYGKGTHWEAAVPGFSNIANDNKVSNIHKIFIQEYIENEFHPSKKAYTLSGGPRSCYNLNEGDWNYDYFKFWGDYYDRYHTEELGWVNTFQSILLLQSYCKANGISFIGMFIHDILFTFLKEHKNSGMPYAYQLYEMIDFSDFWFYDKFVVSKKVRPNVLYIETVDGKNYEKPAKHPWHPPEYEPGDRVLYGGITEWVIDHGYTWDGHPQEEGHAKFAEYFAPYVIEKMK